MSNRSIFVFLLVFLVLPAQARQSVDLHEAMAAVHHAERDSLGNVVGDASVMALQVQRAAASALLEAASVPEMLRLAIAEVSESEREFLAGAAYKTPAIQKLINTVAIVGPLAGMGLLIGGQQDAATSLALGSASVAGVGGLFSLREDGKRRQADREQDLRTARSRAGRAVIAAEFLQMAHALEHLNDDAAELAQSDEVDAAMLAKLTAIGGPLLGTELLLTASLLAEAGQWLNEATMANLQPLAQEMARVRTAAGTTVPMLPMATEMVQNLSHN